jgi:predicted ATP-dependent serine protease
MPGPPKMYECNECGASWSERNARNCLHCKSKDIVVYWEPGSKPKNKKPKRGKDKWNIIQGW